MSSDVRRFLSSISPRRSFAAKLTVAFLSTVGFLLFITLLAVRVETATQVTAVSDRAVETAEVAFEQLETFQHAQLSRVAAPLTEGIRAVAVLEELIMAGDRETLLQNVTYELERNQIDPSEVFLAFTGSEGISLLTYVGGEVMQGDDPADVTAVVQGMINQGVPETRLYRVVAGRLFDVQVRLLQLVGPPLGAVALGFPIDDADVAGIGRVAGVEVCFVVEGSCVAATPLARRRLAPALESLAGEADTMAEAEGQRWRVLTLPLSPERPADGSRVVAVPLDAVLLPFARISRTLLLSGMATLLLAILITSRLGKGLARPVRALVAATGRVASGDLTAEVDVKSQDELGSLAGAFNEMTRGLRLKERYRGLLDKVVSREVAEELTKGEVVLGGENRLATVLFADVRGFTALTEGMEPQRVIGLINECMEILSAAVDAEGGVVDKYVGDELMAVFGAPIRREDDALRAVRAGLLMREGMEELNRRRTERGEAPLGVGIGINTGTVVAGNMGSHERLNYTVLGDAVNLGARLCSGAGRGDLLVTEATLAACGAGREEIEAEALGGQSFKGFSSDVQVYRVLSLESNPASRTAAAHPSPAASPARAAQPIGSQ